MDMLFWLKLNTILGPLIHLVLSVAILSLGLVMVAKRPAAGAGGPPRA